MSARIPVSIVTPERIAWEGEADSLVVPAHGGLLGILPGHAPLVCQMREGVLRLGTGPSARLLAVSGGFVEVCGGRVSIFAETAELAEEIDAERARQAVEKAKAALKDRRGGALDADRAAQAALRQALVRLKAAGLAARRPSRPPV